MPEYGAAFSPDGRHLATIRKTSGKQLRYTVVVQELESGAEVARLTAPADIHAVAFSPDGKWVLTGSLDNTVRLWLWRTPELIENACTRLPHNLSRSDWKTFLPDEPYRATCGEHLPMPD